MTARDLLLNARDVERQGCPALAERLRARAITKAPSLPSMTDADLDRLAAGILAADLGTMTDQDLEVLAEVVEAELARRGGGRGPGPNQRQEAGSATERGGREK